MKKYSNCEDERDENCINESNNNKIVRNINGWAFQKNLTRYLALGEYVLR